jgi:hypothetical protein
MAVLPPRYGKEEFARRGDEIYEREIRPHLEAGNEDKFVVIDIDTGAYEIDTDELAASDRLLARHPNAQVWLTRVGSRYARRLGTRAQLMDARSWPLAAKACLTSTTRPSCGMPSRGALP